MPRFLVLLWASVGELETERRATLRLIAKYAPAFNLHFFAKYADNKKPPRLYEAGAENAHNIQAIYGDSIKTRKKRLFITKCKLHIY